MTMRLVIIEFTFCEAVGYTGKMWYSSPFHQHSVIVEQYIVFIHVM